MDEVSEALYANAAFPELWETKTIKGNVSEYFRLAQYHQL
jgi:hypothetical protein